jgi:uncharacterized membrane protein
LSDFEAHSSTHRLEAFSDGVFAIAITLLIIEIGVPHVEEGESLGDAIWDLWPSFGAYILSFTTIGIYWVNHHSIFELFRRVDHYFLLVNVAALMTIAFIPFPTAVLGDYLDNADQRGDAVTLYTIGLLLPATTWLFMWAYACWRGLIVQGLAPGYVRFLTWQYVISNVIYIAAIALSFVQPWLALGICSLTTAAYILAPRRPRFAGSHEEIQRDHDHLEEP